MSNWYWMDGQQRVGPISSRDLKQLADSGRIKQDTLIWREGTEQWVPAERIQGLFAHLAAAANGQPGAATVPPPLPPQPQMAAPSGIEAATNKGAAEEAVAAARQHAKGILDDVRSVSFRSEVVPIDSSNLLQIISDYAFWGIVALAVGPLLIQTIPQDLQLTAFALLFAGLWGVIFKYFVLRTPTGLLAPLAAVIGTGVFGISLLLWLYQHVFPTGYVYLPSVPNTVMSFIGSVFQTGLWEELIKSLPVFAYLYWPRKRIDPVTAVAVGIFSGLGFAAFENVLYAKRTMIDALGGTLERGLPGFVEGVRDAQINILLRSLALVFLHATLTGIVAYFATIGRITERRRVALFLVGWSVAALLHGTYNWSARFGALPGAGIVCLSFMLFYTYWIKLRTMISPLAVAESSEPATAAQPVSA